jgi:hypothetical protein
MIRGLLRGQSVEVIRVKVSYVDGERVESTERETVQNVLVCPGATADSAANARPDADRVAYTLAFPKGYDKPLRNCRIVIHGREYRVMGDPQPCREDCPTRFWMQVEVERVDG